MSACDELEARFEKKLFGERVTHLDSRPLCIAGLREILGSEGGSMNSVATRAGAYRHYRVAHALGLCPNQVFLVHQADAHRIDERIGLVSRVEDDLAGDGRNANAVTVVTNSLDDARKQISHARTLERSKAQRVEHCHRACSHCEDVTENSADTGRGSLIWLDGRGMIV